MEWTNEQRNELFYHVNRICRVADQYGIGTAGARVICDALEDILAKDYNGVSVVNAVKELIHKKGRVPLPSEIQEVLDDTQH